MSIARRGILYQVRTVISAAQLRTLNTAPVEVAPAPGAGRAIVSFYMVGEFVPVTYPYSQPDNAVIVASVYVDPSKNQFSANYKALLQSAAATYQGTANADLNPLLTASAANLPLLLKLNADLTGGQIAASTRNAGGTGYAVNDTGTIDPGNNGSAAYKVLTLGADNAVSTYQITDPGNGYVVTDALDTDSSGIGTGFKVNVTGINKGDGRLITTVLYAVVPLS